METRDNPPFMIHAFFDRVRAWFEFDLAATRMILLRFAPDLEPVFSAPALYMLRWIDGLSRRTEA